MTDHDVVVVGAGLAGLSTARALSRAGMDVVVIEARDRLGGRVRTLATEDGTIVDLGAQWIGAGQDRVARLAREAGVVLSTTWHAGDSVFEGGTGRRRATSVARDLGVRAGADAAAIAVRLARIAGAVRVEDPASHPCAQQLDGLPFVAWLDEVGATERGRSAWSEIAAAGFCTDPAQVSMLEAVHQIATVGGLRRLFGAEEVFSETGMAPLVAHLATSLANRVRLGCAVSSVGLEDDTVVVRSSDGTVTARRCVVAVPPQLAATLLDEGLADRTGLIRDPVLGSVIKTVLVFDTPWWRERGLSGTASSEIGPVASLADVSGRGRSVGILVALSSGFASRVLAADPDRDRAVTAHVGRLLGDPPAPPRSVTSVDWSAQAWSLGGYASRRRRGAWTTGIRCDQSCPVVLAGTETATEWRSYMEGALQSADRAAAQVRAGI